MRYLCAISDVTRPDKRDAARVDVALARAEAMVYGSDATLKALDVFSGIIDVSSDAEISLRGPDFAPRALRAYGELVKAMRDDVIDDSALTAIELSTLAPFKKPNNVAPK